MKVLKILAALVVVVVIAVVVIATLVLNNINQLTVDTVQEQGTKILKTNVTLAEANIEPSKGRGQLNNLQIANPPGFKSEYAFHMGAVILQIDPASLLGDVQVIKEVTIDGAKLIAEQKNLKDTNLQALLDNLDTGGEEPAAQDDTSAGPDVRLMVEKFRFTNSNVRLISEQFGERTISLPAIKLDNIGDKTTGLTPEELGQAVIAPVLEQVKVAVTAELTELAKEKAKEKLQEKLEEKLSEKLGGEAVNKLKGLFGR